MVGDEWGFGGAVARWRRTAIEKRVALSLRNASQRRIRGITLTVLAQEATPGGKGSISVPSLDVAPGETFSVRGDLHLLRPIGAGASPMVEVSLDGVLFDDLNFYGPDKLHSRRTMMVWELEARRDRQYFKALLEQSGCEDCRQICWRAWRGTGDRPSTACIGARPPTNTDGERDLQFAFLRFPDARWNRWMGWRASRATRRGRPLRGRPVLARDPLT